MIVDILDEMTAEITKLIVQLDPKKLVMPSSRNDGMEMRKCKNIDDSFFMFVQDVAAAQNFAAFYWNWRVEREGFLQCGGHFGPVENIFKCMHYQHYFSHTDGLSFHQYHLE